MSRIERCIKEEINRVIFESPDVVVRDGKDNLHSSSENAYAFGGYEGKVLVSDPGNDHISISNAPRYRKYDLPPVVNMMYPGRLWADDKVISFWFYPDTKADLDYFLKRLAREMKEVHNIDINFDGDWQIEVHVEGSEYKLVPLSEYRGPAGEVSYDDFSQRHADPDVGAGGVGKGTYQSKKQKGKEMDRYPGGGGVEKLGYRVGSDPEYSDELERFREVVREAVRVELNEGIVDDPFMSQGKAWVSPDGEVVELTDMSGHAGSVIEDPERFGIEPGKIERLVNEYGLRKTEVANSLAFERGWVRLLETSSEINIQGKRNYISKNMAKMMEDKTYHISAIPRSWTFEGSYPEEEVKEYTLDLEGFMRKFSGGLSRGGSSRSKVSRFR